MKEQKHYNYFYIDLCGDDSGIYKDESDFIEGLMWNRDIAKKYGDKVELKKNILKWLKEDEEFYIEVNGAAFVKTTKSFQEML